ncbi:MAG: hypothetical protein GWN58_35740 [Anaerolineae bacterium]|nr:hypothetical protein [Anaerolineae bacterium]
MRRCLYSLLGLIVAILMLVGCGAPAGSDTAQLAFEAQMQVDSAQRFHVSLGVRNVGQTRYRDHQAFNAAMELWDDAGEKLGSVSVATLWELAPGNAGWPAAYASKLPAGAYQLTWGTRDGNGVVVDFTIVELDGWLYLGEQSIRITDGETPEDSREYGARQLPVDLARVNLAQRLGIDTEAITAQSVEETEFPDASLGVPEPGQMYAQVLTPGYSIKLVVEGQSYEYRASDKRLVFVPRQELAPQGDITIEGVQVTEGEGIAVHGQSTLPDDSCLGSELWADGELQAWWPGETCVQVQNGMWQMNVRLESDGAPAELDPSVQYMLRVYQQNGPGIVSVFAFDLAGPPVP